jgi:hypothetical protein
MTSGTRNTALASGKPRRDGARRRALAPLGLALLLPLGCGGEEVLNPVAVGGGGGGGGAGGGPGAPAEVRAVSAPDRVSIRVELGGDVADVPQQPLAYALSSDRGSLDVVAVAWDPAANAITLETGKQKLGVTYTLAIDAPGDPLDGLGGELMAADTAEFWATDFGDPDFAQYTLVADRVAVGERVVLYLERGWSADDVDETVLAFDTVIFPVETELFHEAPDRDDNGRIVLLGLDGELYYGGYFSPVNALTDQETMDLWGLRSNEMELLYLNVAALGGFEPELVVSHEFSHLLYNEQHSWIEEYWPYHDEGLAECAVHAAFGANETAASYYATDPSGQLALGKSLVQWEYANYSQYAQAYVFWTYVASQIGGVSGYRDLFLSSGNPDVIQELLQQKLGADFATVQLNALAAAWAQAPTGPYGFEGMLALPARPAAVPAGNDNLPLAPFAGVFFPGDAPSVEPVGPGPNVRFIAFDAAGAADLELPFAAEGGVVIALNARFDWLDPTPEPSGMLVPSQAFPGAPRPPSGAPELSWLRAPPRPPGDQALRAWRHETSGF